jgi:hypothetical protein
LKRHLHRRWVVPVRYYFHLTDSDEVIRDEDGLELSDVQAAVISAIEVIKELRAEDPSTLHEWQGWRLEIVDASGRLMQSIPLDIPFSH